jgi:pseudouridine kinase
LDIDVVDLTGAGDALTAAVILGLLEEMEVGEAMRLGVSSAALTIQSRETVCRDLSLEKLYDQLIV